MLLLLTLLLNTLLLVSASGDVVVYWGQNLDGQQKPLSNYCQSGSVDIVVLSFLYQFPSPLQLNFANACEGTYTPDGTLHCSQIAQDIKTCQSNGKKVLLSLGGASGAYGFSSDSQATSFADVLWNKFGKGTEDSQNRPFDDAVVDGFDFDIEDNNQVGYAALATALRSKFSSDSSKTYYLSAAPQCPYPDQSVGDLLEKASIDLLFIQFYNNYCSLGSQFNWNTWEKYAETVSPNKNIQLFLGLPGGPSAAGSGYSDSATVSKYLSQIDDSKYFGGISLWDATSAWSNKDSSGNNFAQQMKSLLSSAPQNPVSSVVIPPASSYLPSASDVSGSATTSQSVSQVTYPSTTQGNIKVPTTLTTVSSTSPEVAETTPANQAAETTPANQAAETTPASQAAETTSASQAAETSQPDTSPAQETQPNGSPAQTSVAAKPTTLVTLTRTSGPAPAPTSNTFPTIVPTQSKPVDNVKVATIYQKGAGTITAYQTIYRTVATQRIVTTITTQV